jgi:site-specific DNA-methyltransferase (adenine-specific)
MLHGGRGKGGVQLTPYYDRDGITIYCGDCLDVMPKLEPEFDAIIADLPYGTTACSWDSVIPLDVLWVEYKRLIKTRGAVVLTGSQPFTSKLVMSNLEWFKYEWVWNKVNVTGFLDVKKRPMKKHENVMVFCQGQSTYHPQMSGKATKPFGKMRSGTNKYQIYSGKCGSKFSQGVGYPQSIIKFQRPTNMSGEDYGLHPTQKPVALMSYLIRTYTNPGEIVLDNTMGSGTTLVAAQQEGRWAIGIELSEDYCQIAVERLRQRSLFAVEVANGTNARQ